MRESTTTHGGAAAGAGPCRLPAARLRRVGFLYYVYSTSSSTCSGGLECMRRLPVNESNDERATTAARGIVPRAPRRSWTELSGQWGVEGAAEESEE